MPLKYTNYFLSNSYHSGFEMADSEFVFFFSLVVKTLLYSDYFFSYSDL